MVRKVTFLLIFLMYAIPVTPLQIQDNLKSSDANFYNCDLRFSESFVLILTKGKISTEFDQSISNDLLNPNKNPVVRIKLPDLKSISFKAQIRFEVLLLVFKGVEDVVSLELIEVLLNSTSWNSNSKIILTFENNLLHPTSESFLDLLNALIYAGIFNVAILLPRKDRSSPCHLLTMSPFSHRLEVISDPHSLDPKRGRSFFNLNQHFLQVYFVEMHPHLFMDQDGSFKGPFAVVVEDMLSLWNATRTWTPTDYYHANPLKKWTRNDVISKFWYVTYTTQYFRNNHLDEAFVEMTSEPYSNEIDIILRTNSRGGHLTFAKRAMLNLYSLSILLVYLAANVIYLCWYYAAGNKPRISIIQHLIDTFPLCCLQTANLKFNTPQKRIFFAGLVTTLFFLSNAFHCRFTSKLIKFPYLSKASTLEDLVEQNITVVINPRIREVSEYILNGILSGASIKHSYNYNYVVHPEMDLAYVRFGRRIDSLDFDRNIEGREFGELKFRRVKGNRGGNPLMLIYPKHSPFVADFEKYRWRIFEAGIEMCYLGNASKEIMTVNQLANAYNKRATLQMNHMLMSLSILGVCQAVALIVFLLEFRWQQFSGSLGRLRCKWY